jgi:ClpP class serine protease
MRHLAYFLDIQFDEILVTPTFNRSSIKANTSFEMKQSGILNSTLTRYKTLTDEELEIIDNMTKKEYQKVLGNIVEF